MEADNIRTVITFSKPGTVPPVFVAGTFSDPPWEPIEMDQKGLGDNGYEFTKTIHGKPGTKIQYKFRIGNGDQWVCDENTPTITDAAGNENNVLEMTAPDKQPKPLSKPRQRRPTYAQVAAKHLQESPTESDPAQCSETHTAVFAKIAAEVADSAALLHEEVPDRESPGSNIPKGEPLQSSRRFSEAAATAAEVADTAAALDQEEEQNTYFLGPPAGEGSRLRLEFREERDDDFISQTSPLFAHECAGLQGAEVVVPSTSMQEDDGPLGNDYTEEFDPHQYSMHDPNLEEFPSEREEIFNVVARLESEMEPDQPFYEGLPRDSVFIPSRRGTLDITGEHILTAPACQASQAAPSSRKQDHERRPSADLTPTPAIHAAVAPLAPVLEADEPSPGTAPAEGQQQGPTTVSPPIVFSNPNPLTRARPPSIQITAEDEGVALSDGISPRTVKPMAGMRLITPPGSGEVSPPRKQERGPRSKELIQGELGKADPGLQIPEEAEQHAGESEMAEAVPEETPLLAGSGHEPEEGMTQQEQEQREEGAASSLTETLNALVPGRPEGGWIKALFRLLFVDLIGGLLRGLWRGVKRLISAS